MKNSLLCVALGLVLASVTSSKAETWETDYAKALKTAAADKKMVLMDFTGSDWCVWCKKLDKEVFSQPEFKEFAQKNLVLLQLDFPHETALPEAVTKQNETLAKKFGVEGFPTVVVLNEAGKKVGELGYEEGGAAKFIQAIKALPKS